MLWGKSGQLSGVLFNPSRRTGGIGWKQRKWEKQPAQIRGGRSFGAYRDDYDGIWARHFLCTAGYVTFAGDTFGFCEKSQIEEALFKAILRKLDFERIQFEKEIQDFSGGQKKKVLIAKSLCEQAHLYVWDEPLNFVDLYSRMQIEQLIREFSPTMLLVEHDQAFREAVATKTVQIEGAENEKRN